MTTLVRTTDIVTSAKRLDGPKRFFGPFSDAWAGASRTVLKLETRQEYREPGNASWEKLASGDISAAMRMIPESRAVDVPLYNSLGQRKIRFIRCRPVKYPLTPYLRWELGCYDFNAEHGEEILLSAIRDVEDLIEDYALHDFMVFDEDIAFVHDYDETGEIQGGWQVNQQGSIAALQEIFSAFKARCQPLRRFLAANPPA